MPDATLAGLGRRLRRLETRISSFDTATLSSERHLMGAVAVLGFWLLFVTCSVLDPASGRNAAEVAVSTGLITVLTFSALTYLVIRTLGSDEHEGDADEDDLLIAV